VVTDDARAGVLVAVFDLEAALGAMLSDHRDLGYSVSVREGDTLIYVTPGAKPEDADEWGAGAEPRIPGVSWRVRVWPNPELLTEMRSPLPELALVLGGLLGLLLMLAVHFARAAGLRSRELGRARDEVERRVQARTARAATRREAAEESPAHGPTSAPNLWPHSARDRVATSRPGAARHRAGAGRVAIGLVARTAASGSMG
jgi:C4-dicarboxylate-specific signal transduction histidine kinase